MRCSARLMGKQGLCFSRSAIKTADGFVLLTELKG